MKVRAASGHGHGATRQIADALGDLHRAAPRADQRAGVGTVGATSGFLVFALSAAAFERGSPAVSAPATTVVTYFAAHRAGLLAQSLLFVLSAGINLWFLGSLRAYLLRDAALAAPQQLAAAMPDAESA